MLQNVGSTKRSAVLHLQAFLNESWVANPLYFSGLKPNKIAAILKHLQRPGFIGPFQQNVAQKAG